MSKALLALWVLITVIIGGALTALHTVPLPAVTPAWQAPTGQWVALHVLSARCPCSRRVAVQLAARGAQRGVHEHVALIDATSAVSEPLRAAGFEVDALAGVDLEARYGVLAAPTLVLRRPDGSVAYAGGYAPRNTLPARDLEIFAQARASGADVPAYPTFGCAVSRQLQAAIDPLNLKYGDTP